MPITRLEYKNNVADIVRTDYRTADIFEKYGINYCCGGQATLEEACLLKGIQYANFIEELNWASQTLSISNKLQFNEWKIDFLIDYIINVHHAYLYQVLPVLKSSLTGFVNNHKRQYPVFQDILEMFEVIAALLLAHNKHEEEIIFPYIKQIENAYRRKESYGNLFVRTLRKPLGNIENEHKKISDLLNKLRSLTDNYKFPDAACTNHRVIFGKLQEFDNDFIQHKNLENNILFPKAIDMEQELLKS